MTTIRLVNSAKTIDMSLLTDLPSGHVGELTVLDVQDQSTISHDVSVNVGQYSLEDFVVMAEANSLLLERYDSKHPGGSTIYDYTSGIGYGDGIGIDIL